MVRVGFVTTGMRSEIDALAALPCDSLWVGGHVLAPSPSPEPIVGLAALAMSSENQTIGTAVVPLALYEPAVIAKQVAEIDRLADGRVRLGIGVGGEFAAEFAACNVPLDQRGARTDKAMEVMRQLWSGEPMRLDGFEDAPRLQPLPCSAGGPPLLVAGRGVPAMRRAARRGDGWFPYLYSPRRYASSVGDITRFADEAGRALDGFQWLAYVFVNVDAESSVAMENAEAHLRSFFGQHAARIVQSAAAIGDAEQVARRLDEYVAAGAQELVLVPSCANSVELARRVVEDVVPKLGSTRA